MKPNINNVTDQTNHKLDFLNPLKNF